MDSAGKSINYIARGDQHISAQHDHDTILSPALTYPPLCGCRDARFLEFNSSFGCNNTDSCKTLIVFGCTDPLACNYNPNANFNLTGLCCYPGYCNNRDISLVCPTLSVNELSKVFSFDLYPNPVQDQLDVKIVSGPGKETVYEIFDSMGRLALKKKLGMIQGNSMEQIDLSELPCGLYMFRLSVDGTSSTKRFIKS